MFYRNQCIGKGVEEVIGNNREAFFRDIINSYCGNTLKINLIKGILRIGLSISLIYIISSLFFEKNSVLIVCSIPLGVFTSVCSYLVNAYIKSDLIAGALNGIIGMSIPTECYKLSQINNNAYTVPIYITILLIISLSIVIFYLFKKKK